MVLTGGYRTETVVSQHSGLAGGRGEGGMLPSLGTGRQVHACGWYRLGEEQVLYPFWVLNLPGTEPSRH